MRKLGVDDYAELVRRSQDEPEWFWPAAIEDMGLEFSRPWDRLYDDGNGIEWTTWFCGGRVSIAWNCVHRHARGPLADVDAAVFQGEDGARYAYTYAELSDRVTRLAEALAGLGVGRATGSRSTCRCRRRRPSRRTPARTSAPCRCPSSRASPLRPSRSASRTAR
ncbi:MAG: acetyl-coenzyme A synthetase N-terminal domain-containing protein [Thermoleophilia bacterium]